MTAFSENDKKRIICFAVNDAARAEGETIGEECKQKNGCVGRRARARRVNDNHNERVILWLWPRGGKTNVICRHSLLRRLIIARAGGSGTDRGEVRAAEGSLSGV